MDFDTDTSSQLYFNVPRTWLERIFSWPWNPFRAADRVRDYEAEEARDHENHRIMPPFARQTYAVPKPAPWPPAPAGNQPTEEQSWKC